MAKSLDQRRINFVKGLTIDVKAKILFEYLKKGTSTRNIEKIVGKLEEEDGWQSWSVVHFYGFDKWSKGKYPSLTLKALKERLAELNDHELEELHLSDKQSREERPIVMGDDDGKDVFRTIKARQGQNKLRRLLLQNYQSKCALCNIAHPKLLITSHIKPWSDSATSIKERVDPCNAILLCDLHDGLFENGFISLNDSFQVLFSSDFDFVGQGISKDITFRKPVKDLPSINFLKEHRVKHGFE